MAATVSPWGKPGAWALDAEEHEAELLKDQKDQALQQSEPSAEFPSLAAAAATKPKKKKGQSIPLSEFQTYGGPKPSPQSSEPKGLTTEDLMMLPTGPRQRTAEEMDRNRLGGGFKNYGQNSLYDRGNRYSNGEDSSNSRWGSSRVFDESRRSNDGSNRELRREPAPPSRADEIDDWGAGKKPMVGNGFERRERGGFFDSNSSKADDSDSWVSNKSFVPSEGRRSGGMGGGFERERRGGFTSNGGGADSDSWGKRSEGGRGGSGENGGGADSDNWGKRSEGGRGGSGERPRLNLQPRTIPLNDGNQEASGAAVKPKGSNPFGNARPREEVLAEKGQDWKKIDEQLESMKVKDTVERAERPTGASFERKGFGVRSGRSPDDRMGRSWRKPDSVDSRPQSAEPEMVDNGPAEEN
ncbi:eukaryotic translation initiation factor 4B3-like [Momordica charantia]|uniref:Eukaryotic translation initiation factor 4B3-like n=1 Tax=Momordica charantia TaxID=3673 RepID=A0A6J1CZ88_MOMCH|nr:eukaryotic translation initiation factor 4B3-like [Momordica charantia]XP_022146307.1 eukaryotic translation initiation factor 4B3-like [Momordica charantia]